MATAAECERALRELAARLDDYRDGAAAPDHIAQGSAADRRRDASTDVDRTLSCSIRDLQVVFAGRLEGGRLRDVQRTESAAAQIRVEVASDDLLALVDGSLEFTAAWLSGRVKLIAGVRDLMRLRALL